jgi:hypothetical protein
LSDEQERVRAVLAGQEGWGQYGSVDQHRRYMDALGPRYRNRSRCSCGCGGKTTHAGLVNGLAMRSGCELSIRRWAKAGPKPDRF